MFVRLFMKHIYIIEKLTFIIQNKYTKVYKIVTIRENTLNILNDYIHCINRTKET